MGQRKGIILAGGSGSRLYPVTLGASKQLMPIYDKPMIYYPLTVLMLAGIRETLIITTKEDQAQFERLLGNGKQWGIKLNYKIQLKPDGLGQAFILAEDFLAGAPSVLILGDNIFFGHGLPQILRKAELRETGATVFGYHVNDPDRYGVIGFNDRGGIESIVEKPAKPQSNYAITGLYFVDQTAPQRAKLLKKSKRDEFEITSLLQSYLQESALNVELLGRGFAWLDTGTHGSLLDAGNFVRTITERQGLQVGSPDEIAYQMSWINKQRLLQTAKRFKNTAYGKYLEDLIE